MNSVSRSPIITPRVNSKPRPRLPLIVLALVLVAAVGYFGYDRFLKPQPAAVATTQLVAVTKGSVVATVSTTGSVVPAQTAELAFKGSGQIEELLVSVGQTVQKGDVLAKLDTTDLELQVLQAEAQLAGAEAKLESVQSGSTAGDVAQARAQVLSTEAKHNQLKAGPTTADLLAAEASVASARAQLEKSQSDLTRLREGLTQEEVTNAKIAIERAKISLHEAQAAYDKVSWRADVGSSKEAMALWQATVDYQSAEAAYNTKMAGPTATELAIAESGVQSARAQLESAEAKLATLAAGPTRDELASAEASLLQAQSQLEAKLSPATKADVQAALASLEQARVGLQSARGNLESATMVAPFGGVIAAVNGAVGQTVSGTVITLLDLSSPQLQVNLAETDVAKVEAGQQALITLEALGGQQISGRLLSITPRASVQSGVATYVATIGIGGAPQLSQLPTGLSSGDARSQMEARGLGQIPADLPPGELRSQLEARGSGQFRQNPSAPTLEGQTPAETTGQGLQQRAQIDLSKVMPGMTATASIVYLRVDDVLMVPNRAIRAQGRDRVVDVLVDGTTETRVVTIGAADEQHTEIVAGLQEGDQVVISGTTTSTTSGGVPGLPGTMPGGRDNFGGGFQVR